MFVSVKENKLNIKEVNIPSKYVISNAKPTKTSKRTLINVLFLKKNFEALEISQGH